MPVSAPSAAASAQGDEPQLDNHGFVVAAKTKDMKPGQLKYVRLRGGVELVLANVNGHYFAFDAYCPHNGWPLKWGAVDRGTLVCALHMWRFDLETGAAVDPPMANCLQTYPTRVVSDVVEVALHLR